MLDHSVAAVVAGVGCCLPVRVVQNTDEPITLLDTTDEWIRSRTGIERRRWAGPGESTGDLAVEAGRRALESAGVNGVDLVVLSTTTPDHHSPATAPWVAAQLGLGSVPAFDIAAACSGFVYAVAAGDAWIKSGTAQRVLVIGAETLSTITDMSDRGTAVVFADGAGAAVLRQGTREEAGAVLAVRLGSDGTQKDLAVIAAGGARWPDPQRAADPGERCLQMQGPQMFGHAVRRMTEVSRGVLEQVGWQVEDVEAFIGHQANQRILDKVASLVGVPAGRCLGNIRSVGNTSSASIPLVMDEAVREKAVAPGARTLLTAFGGGAVWGAVALTWPDVQPSP
ncbi:3-oxoacyl-[acyl-carrier-protein] synthase 3 [Streptomyces xanthophaeus]|uniref:beta-ketoacyl-ACP synthase III n=1 Tax=Streptomyces xanthophaeus TaxID=67385 RepID=UPI00233F3C18|nr:beta-ketoacyl-ACP synthase III [Streptomyces xanthophaeus]WCD90926.1 3-oxoacyl-[acyl-carrier-protein] synthase 3 [Streptomyces xanthophaeus]